MSWFKGLFQGPTQNSALASVKYVTRVSNQSSHLTQNKTQLARIHENVYSKNKTQQLRTNQGVVVDLSGVTTKKGIVVNINQNSQYFDLSSSTEAQFKEAILTEFDKFIDANMNEFKSATVSDLKSAAQSNQSHSMMSSLLTALAGSSDPNLTIGSVIDQNVDVRNLFNQELVNMRTKASEIVNKHNFKEEFVGHVRQNITTKIDQSKALYIQIDIDQDQSTLLNTYSKLEIHSKFTEAFNTSSSFFTQTEAGTSSEATISSSTTTSVTNETIGDMLNGVFRALLLPAIVAGIALVVFLVLYFTVF